jgi:hypothetical protein
MAHETCELRRSDINHLRRLLGYIETEIGQTPEEMESTIKGIAQKLGPNAFDDEGVKALQLSYERAKAVPQYIRAAVKALRKTIQRHEGEILDVEPLDEVLSLENKSQSST